MTERQNKAFGMQLAAKKREILGALTEAEKKTQAEREKSNYIGKKISVDGQNGTVIGNPFGKVKVQFEDGTEQTVKPHEIAAPVEKTVANGAVKMPADVQAAPEPVQAQPVKAPEMPKTEPNAPVQAPVEMFKKIDSLANLPKEERQAALKQMKSDYDGSGFERARRINGNIAEIVRRMEEKGVLEKICD